MCDHIMQYWFYVRLLKGGLSNHWLENNKLKPLTVKQYLIYSQKCKLLGFMSFIQKYKTF